MAAYVVFNSDYGSFDDAAWQANPSSSSSAGAMPSSLSEVSRPKSWRAGMRRAEVCVCMYWQVVLELPILMLLKWL